MSAVLDERARHRARSRAKAATILDAPRVVRRFVAHDSDALRATERRRSSRAAVDEPAARRRLPSHKDGERRRRHIAVGVLGVQVAVLAGALWLPVFHVSEVDVTGTSLLSTSALISASGLQSSTSVFRVDGDAVRNKLLGIGWVRTAVVETELPNTVRIKVQELPPIMHLRTHGYDLLVAPGGASMPVSGSNANVAGGLPLLIDNRTQGGPELDVAAAGGSLARVLAVTAQRFPAVFGCAVASFEWGVNGQMSINTTTGWRAILGHIDSQASVGTVADQLAALAALKGSLDFVHPAFGYVDLESPKAPAVGGSPSAPGDAASASAPPHAPVPGTPPLVAAGLPAASPAKPAPATPVPPIHQFVLTPPAVR